MTDPRRELIVSLAWESWGGPRRGEGFLTSDRFVRSVLADDRLARTLVVNATRSAPVVAVSRLLGRRTDQLADRADATVMTPLRVRRHPPVDPEAVRRAQQRYVDQVARRARSIGMVAPAVVTMNPLVAGLGRFPWPLTYFGFDDWAAHPRFAHLHSAIELAYAGIAQRGIPVAAVSQTILDRVAPTAEAIVVPNGLSAAEWERPGEPPAWLAEVPSPRAIYVGGLDERMDTTILTTLIEARPDLSVVLLGSGGDRAPYTELAQRPNVTVHAEVGRSELTAAVAACDIGLVPHARNDLTRSMSPLKVYEYLAAGLPVAAVDLAPMHDIDDRVVLAQPRGFVAAVDEALALERWPEDERLAFLAENDWRSRHRRIVDLALGATPSAERAKP